MTPYLQQLSRKTIYILGLVALGLVGSGYMTWLTVQEAGAKLVVEKQVVSANQSLVQVTSSTNVEALKTELAAAQGQLKEAAFPEQVPSVSVVALLVKAAKETGVELSNLQVLVVEQEKLGNNNYNVLRQRLQARGTPMQLTGFLNRLEKGEFRSLVMNNLALVPRDITWEARMDMYIYSTR